MATEHGRVRTRRPLSQRRIVEAALKLVDREGLDELSMRRLGARLGVEAMALYRYYPNKAALLDAVLEEVHGEIELPLDGESWQSGLRRFARSWRAMARQHPRILPLLVTRGRMNPGVVRAREAVQRMLRSNGFDDDATFKAECAVVGYTMGLTMLMVGPTAFGDGAADTAVSAASPAAGRDPDADFEFGLDAVLSGLERSRHPRPPVASGQPGTVSA